LHGALHLELSMHFSLNARYHKNAAEMAITSLR